jgi:hypothetical protein
LGAVEGLGFGVTSEDTANDILADDDEEDSDAEDADFE